MVRAYYKTTSANKNITGYTVSVPSKTVTPDKNGKYVVTVKYAGKTATVAIPVADDKPQPTVSKITVSSTIPYLDNEKVVDDKLKAQIKASLTVRVTMSDGSTKVLDSDAYKLKVISSVTSYSGEGGGFRVDVEYGNNYGKCYIPVLHGLYAESTFDGTFTEGATFDKSAFKKTLSVYNLFVDADWEACTDYKIEAPDTVRVNGTGDHAGRFVITITSGQWSYELAYQVVKGGTADPGDSEVGGGQEVDWLGYYTLAGKSYIEDEYIDGAISIYGNINVPEEYADEYEILHWGILYSRTNSTPTWDSYENYSLVLQNSFNQSLPFEFLFDNTRAPLKNGDLVYFRTYLALKRKEDTSSTPKQYFFYSNTVLPLTIRDYR